MSKGDKPRPLSVSYKQYSDNYEAIFGKKEVEVIDGMQTNDDEALWDEEQGEKRIDIIGQNGNDGLHYDKIDGES
jgi:hypothetical protein|tara:strand:+ start:162 stop:386 length:225 start_codon:yes stop_codon:yes gene_type:complete